MIEALLAALLAVAIPTPTPLVVHQYPTPVPIRPQAYFPALVSVPAWMVAERTATSTPIPPATPVPDLRTRLYPATDGALKATLQVPGALVAPACGEYRPHGPLRIKAGVTLDGRGCVTLRGEGVLVYEADGVTIQNLRIVDADGDAISVNKSRNILIERVDISGWGDGGIDIVRTPPGGDPHVIRDSLIHGGKKGSLLGHQWEPVDDGARVLLERVAFRDVWVRTPKVHRARVTMVDCTVTNWSGPMLDVQLGGHLHMVRTRWEAGPASLHTYYTPTGGSISEEGTVWVPFRRQQPVMEQ